MTTPNTHDGPVKVLLLEDSDFDAELIGEFLRQMNPAPDVARVVGRSDFVAAIETASYDAILSDYSLPGFDGMAALELSQKHAPGTPFIFVSGVLGEEIAIESLRNGATDYVLKQRLIRLPAAVSRAVAEAREREERRRAERQLKLLVAELSHRVKNTLAAVMSIVRRTSRRHDSVADYEQALLSRLRALSDAHSLLFEADWRETSLGQVLDRTFEPFRREGDRSLHASGPEVKLAPKSALALSLIFHELITNAIKHGALSKEQGRVTVEWRRKAGADETVDIHLRWHEAGGPPVSQPERLGFGTHLIERSARYDLDGKATLAYATAGFVCDLDFAAGVG
jgi:two-component sensor histidine kinase